MKTAEDILDDLERGVYIDPKMLPQALSTAFSLGSRLSLGKLRAQPAKRDSSGYLVTVKTDAQLDP